MEKSQPWTAERFTYMVTLPQLDMSKYLNPDYHIFNIGDLVRAKNWMTGSPGLIISASCYGYPGPDLLKIPQYAVRWDFDNEHLFLPFDLEVWK